jgi:hypothetical protein
MNPPLRTRLAVATILGCLGVLLLSACGFGGGYKPSPRPVLQREDFVIWQRDPEGGLDRPIGAGTINGAGNSIFARVQLSTPPCLSGIYSFINVSAPAFANTSASFTLFANSQTSAGGSAHSSGPYQWTLDFPLLFSFASDTCHPAIPIRATASNSAALSHSWTGSFGSGQTASYIRVALYQTRPTAMQPAVLWGEITGNRMGCYGSARLPPVVLSGLNQASYIFRTQTNAAITVKGLPTTLDPDPPPNPTITLNYTGGPCDGQVLTTTLSK